MRKRVLLMVSIFLFSGFYTFAKPQFNLDSSQKDSIDYLSDLETQVISELNLARSEPEIYAGFLESYSELIVGKELREPGKITIMTKEGKSAVNEAVRFLKKQPSLPIFSPSKGMSKAAADMVRMQETTTHTGHIGEDGSNFVDRMNRYGKWFGACGENIDYGNNNARRIVMALIIDDGVKNRGHRKNIFNPQYYRIGVSCGGHKKYNYMCVIDFAKDYTD